MASQLLRSKIRAPRPVEKPLHRARLSDKLDEGFSRRLTLVSASAGFGKTTLIADWIARRGIKAAWLSLDSADGDPVRLLAYVSAALRTICAADIPDPEVLLGASGSISADSVLSEILEGCASVAGPFSLVLDDWHSTDSPEADRVLAALVERLPGLMHLVLSSREDPALPLARLRSLGLLTEIRTSDLRFTPEESSEFFRGSLGDRLGREEVAAVDGRVEGWAAGLQLTAIALRGKGGNARGGAKEEFIAALARSGRFVLDYLLEEVFALQPPAIRDFLLRTSILERFTGPLCDALLGGGTEEGAPAHGQDTIEYLERANLFIVPLDDERRWYRYHHLFSELLRQRLAREVPEATGGASVPELHRRAGAWLEAAGQGVEAFRHVAASGDIEGAARLLDGPLMPKHSREAMGAAVEWLSSLPKAELDRRPALWVTRATICLAGGMTKDVEKCLRSAEPALAGLEPDEAGRDLRGRVSTARATLALTRYDAEAMTVHALAALDALAPDDAAFRSSASWILGTACQALGRRDEAERAFEESLALSRSVGDIFSSVLAVVGLGEIREASNDLHGAVGAYGEALALAGEHPLPNVCEAYLGKARILFEWNDLDAAEESCALALALARTYEAGIDRFIPCEVLLARIELARGRAVDAADALEATEKAARSGGFALRLREIAAAKSAVAIARGNAEAAVRFAKESGRALVEASAFLAAGRAAEALAVIGRSLAEAEERRWPDEILAARILESLAFRAAGRRSEALASLERALVLAESGGFARSFANYGLAMEELLEEEAARGIMADAAVRILAAFRSPADALLLEPLSVREREVLALVAKGLSNQEIGERLFLALDSVKGHNRRIFEKLGVRRRTAAVARARELGLI